MEGGGRPRDMIMTTASFAHKLFPFGWQGGECLQRPQSAFYFQGSTVPTDASCLGVADMQRSESATLKKVRDFARGGRPSVTHDFRRDMNPSPFPSGKLFGNLYSEPSKTIFLQGSGVPLFFLLRQSFFMFLWITNLGS